MKYFDKQLLESLPTEAICRQLDAYQEIENNTAIPEGKYRTLHCEAMRELLEYFFKRLQQEFREEFGLEIEVVEQKGDVATKLPL